MGFIKCVSMAHSLSRETLRKALKIDVWNSFRHALREDFNNLSLDRIWDVWFGGKKVAVDQVAWWLGLRKEFHLYAKICINEKSKKMRFNFIPAHTADIQKKIPNYVSHQSSIKIVSTSLFLSLQSLYKWDQRRRSGIVSLRRLRNCLQWLARER